MSKQHFQQLKLFNVIAIPEKCEKLQQHTHNMRAAAAAAATAGCNKRGYNTAHTYTLAFLHFSES
jgi:hypothetical protein